MEACPLGQTAIHAAALRVQRDTVEDSFVATISPRAQSPDRARYITCCAPGRSIRLLPTIRDGSADRIGAHAHAGQSLLVDRANVVGRLVPHQIADSCRCGNDSRHACGRHREGHVQRDTSAERSLPKIIELLCALEEKVDILQNAIDLAQPLSIATPKVAVLSAVETITSKIPSTIDAAALCKMAERGQITGAILDGPLALDNAISREAAAVKHLTSPVAGDADILLVPDMEAGNMLAKELTFLANADAAGIVIGARVPIILTSRADNARARMASCAIVAPHTHARRSAAASICKLAD